MQWPPTEYDLMEARHERDRLLAQQELLRQAKAAQPAAPRRQMVAPLLAWLGRRLTAAGTWLQARNTPLHGRDDDAALRPL